MTPHTAHRHDFSVVCSCFGGRNTLFGRFDQEVDPEASITVPQDTVSDISTLKTLCQANLKQDFETSQKENLARIHQLVCSI